MLTTAIHAAKETGKFLLENFGKTQNIEEKGSALNIVTEVDKESERRIVEIIKRDFPDHSILAEEGSGDTNISDYRWIIDPLDGTTNFTHNIPIFCVSIAVEYKNKLLIGVIYDPTRDELFTAEKGKGAYLNEKPIRVSSTRELKRSVLITGFPYNLHENPYHTIEIFNDFLLAARAIRRLGSAAIDLAYIAAGRGEGFWEVYLHPWDIAAGILIVEEAGGKVTDFFDKPIDIYSKQVAATNGLIHSEMLGVLRRRV